MKTYKVEKILEELCRAGFSMSTWEFYETTIFRILKRYGIKAHLELNEYFELMVELKDLCAENDLKDLGITYFDENELKSK